MKKKQKIKSKICATLLSEFYGFYATAKSLNSRFTATVLAFLTILRSYSIKHLLKIQAISFIKSVLTMSDF